MKQPTSPRKPSLPAWVKRLIGTLTAALLIRRAQRARHRSGMLTFMAMAWLARRVAGGGVL